MKTDSTQSYRFNSLLVDYLNYFNLIELNVGLCISHLASLSTSEIYKKIDKMSFEKKLEYLLKLANIEEDKTDLKSWCREAHAKRHERNMYMHGQWQLFPHFEKNIEFLVAPWVKQKYEKIYPGSRFTIQKLEEIVSEIKTCFNQFQAIRKKYGI